MVSLPFGVAKAISGMRTEKAIFANLFGIAPTSFSPQNFRFGLLSRASYASPAVDTTNLPPEQAPARLAGFGRPAVSCCIFLTLNLLRWPTLTITIGPGGAST